MPTSGATCARPFCSVEHVSVLLQTAASSRLSLTSSSWAGRRHRGGIRRRAEKVGFVGHRDYRGVPKLSISPYIAFQSRFQEGGADSNNKGSDHHNAFTRRGDAQKEPSLLLNLVQEIQPLDVSQISKEASPESIDAMKRTISGMLGLLPSDQFQVTVETSRVPLVKLLVSSMMTGYTLRNAEYRFCLQKSLEFSDDEEVNNPPDKEFVKHEVQFGEVESLLEPVLHDEENCFFTGKALEAFQGEAHVVEDEMNKLEPVEPLSEGAKKYIQYLKQKLQSVSKELEEYKQVNTGIQVQSIVGEEKNDLLDYLRSLAPDKVVELSQPASSEVEDVIQHVIDEILENPSANLHHKASQIGGSQTGGRSFSGSWEQDVAQKFSHSPLQSRAVVAVNRDHLARLLFWCMLLGHHMRGLEYRLELSRTLSLSGDMGLDVVESKDG